MEFNKNTVKFMTTPDGIRGAVYIGDDVPCHMWQGNKPKYI